MPAYVIPPTRDRTGGVVVRIDVRSMVVGALREKEDPSLEEGSGEPWNANWIEQGLPLQLRVVERVLGLTDTNHST
jgi:hypothetical protein